MLETCKLNFICQCIMYGIPILNGYVLFESSLTILLVLSVDKYFALYSQTFFGNLFGKAFIKFILFLI